jgi:predicted transcriptional regulator/Holliday junction resolvase-like predicted endonuclease
MLSYDERNLLYNKAMGLRRQGLGKRRIAKLLGISEATVSEWLHRGAKPPSGIKSLPKPTQRKRSHKRWTAEEREKLKQLYFNTPINEIAKILGRTRGSIRSQADKLGLHSRLGTKNIKKMIESKFGSPLGLLLKRLYYEENLSQNEIARLLGVTQQPISRWFKKFGIKARDLSEAQRLSYETNKDRRRKTSEQAKKLTAQGKFRSPFRKKDEWTEEEARTLFEQYVKSRQPLKVFAKRVHHGSYLLSYLFRKYFPDDYEMVVESRSMNPYKKGRYFEYRVRDFLKQKGYWILRSPRSQGIADLVAIKKGEVLLIQCKTYKYGLKNAEKEKLVEIARSIGAEPYLAYRERRGQICLEKLK